MENKVIPSLDGIRAISVLLVFFSHSGLGHIVPGGFGVTTFFFLSGYLITTLLLIEYKKNNNINFKYFFIRRSLRLLPPLLLTIFISIILVHYNLLGGGISIEGTLSQIFYLANYHSIFNWPGSIPSGTGVFWSLAVEEHFYLIFPFIFYFIIHNHKKKTVLETLLFICFIVLIWRYVLVLFSDVGENRTYYATDTRIDSIIFGCILAIGLNPIFSEKKVSMNISSYIIVFVSVLLLLLTFLYRDPVFRESIRYTIQGIFLAPLFYFSIKYHNHIMFRFLNSKIMIKIGQYSYFIYLIHYIVIKSLEQSGIINNMKLLIVLSFILSLSYAFIVNEYFDVHFRKLRKKFK